MDLNSKIEAAKEEVGTLKQKLESVLTEKRDQTLDKAAGGTGSVVRCPPDVKCRRTLKGHYGKVVALHWSGDSQTIVSAGQDGILLIWNAVSSNKLQSIALKSSYVMSVGIEQTRGQLVACGGLDNLCTIYNRSTVTTPTNPPPSSSAEGGAGDSGPPTIEMASHDGYLSCCRFLGENSILTSSGDSTCIHWDVPSAKPISTFAEHQSDVMSMSLKPDDNSTFVSCSVDQTVKLWDTRAPKSSVQTYSGFHTNDVNGIEFMPSNSNCFASCSEDNTVRLFDIRAYNEVMSMTGPTPQQLQQQLQRLQQLQQQENGATANGPGAPAINLEGAAEPPGEYGQAAGVDGLGNEEAAGAAREGAGGTSTSGNGFTSIAFSVSGRQVFCGHANGSVMAYDVLSDQTGPVYTIEAAHNRHVSCVGVNPEGTALCTGSWDSFLKVWA